MRSLLRMSTRTFVQVGGTKKLQWRWMVFSLILILGISVSGCQLAWGASESSPSPEPTSTLTTTPIVMLGSIQGVVWHDQCDNLSSLGEVPEGCVSEPSSGAFHANGIREIGEPGISQQEVTLGLGICPAKGLATSFTGSNGEYSFTNLEPGEYCVSVESGILHLTALEPGLWTFPRTEGGMGVGSFTVTVKAGKVVQGVDFGWDYALQPDLEILEPTITPSPEPVCTDHATFISDVTIPDGTRLEEGVAFEKVWRLRNTGTCTWTPQYSSVFHSGDLLGAIEVNSLLQEVLPGYEIDLSVQMIAPEEQGNFRSYWMLMNDEGQLFGIGENADKPFWVKIRIISIPSSEEVVSWIPELDPSMLSDEGRWIDVDLSDQTLTAYEGSNPIMTFLVSTGTASYPTITGQFRIWVKLETTRMTGPGYVLEDVPHTMYFYQGYGLHGAYWHDDFGTPRSHGCVNLSLPDAQWLYNFASIGTLVNVHL